MCARAQEEEKEPSVGNIGAEPRVPHSSPVMTELTLRRRS